NSHGGWNATNTATGKRIRIKSPQRLRHKVSPKNGGKPPAANAAVVETTAPPSIVPAEAAQSEAEEDRPGYDPARCATEGCKGTPVMTYLDRPLCQACWERHCEEQEPSEVGENTIDPSACDAQAEACHPIGEPQTPEQVKAMPKSKSTNKQSEAQKRDDRDLDKAPRSELTLEEAERLAKVRAAKAKKAAADQPKRLSALDAAAEVLKTEGKPMRAKELIEAMAAQGLWSSPGGKTPEATLYAAMSREIKKADENGTVSRFRKTDRGQFEYNDHHA
ncbi:MAG TPA: winged helix-turn-helix domain-containing protein, partial [Phycisphaerae bacterium]|nr:winged helix-turn-helix domain-containing protein [Phycisphaerae bacterium]